jgi:hypothetical protein
VEIEFRRQNTEYKRQKKMNIQYLPKGYLSAQQGTRNDEGKKKKQLIIDYL